MILIAHRGNICGPNPDMENCPFHVAKALAAGFAVEVDAWYFEGWYLGHDRAEYRVGLDFLKADGLWVHCKHHEALRRALDAGLHCFYHTDEDYALTSRGYIWAYPGQAGGDRTICVMPELTYQSVAGFVGVCSDFAASYR